MKYIKQISFLNLTLLLIFLIVNGVQAQVKPPVKPLENNEIIVVAPYAPSLSDANKINITPDIKEKELDKPDLKYAVTPRFINATFEPARIVPARLSGEPMTKLYQSYIRAGMGNYTTPYAEIFYNKLRSRTSTLGINYKHYSSSGKIKDFAPAAFSDNILNAYGSYFTESHLIDGDLLYKRNAFHYYGFKPLDYNLTANDSLKKVTFQKYQTLEASAAIKSDYNDKDKLHHAAGIKFYNLKNTKTVENAISFNANINKNINLLRKIDNEKLILEVDANYFNNPEFLASKDAAEYSVKPQVSFLMNQYALKVGLNTSIETGDESYIRFFPIIEGQIAIAKDVLSLYGAFTGGVERNNYRTLFEENPFIIADFDSLEFTTNKVLFKGGLKGNIASAFTFNLGAGFRESENMPFFVNDTIDFFNKFNLVYDDATVVNVFADLTFQTSEKLFLMLKGAFNHYTMTVEKAAWHKPTLTANFMAGYNLVDKINIKVEIYAQDKTSARLFDATKNPYAADVKAFTDVNLGLEYLYNKKISAFLNLNNIAGARYYRWYNYPTQRFHILGGLTYAF